MNDEDLTSYGVGRNEELCVSLDDNHSLLVIKLLWERRSVHFMKISTFKATTKLCISMKGDPCTSFNFDGK